MLSKLRADNPPSSRGRVLAVLLVVGLGFLAAASTAWAGGKAEVTGQKKPVDATSAASPSDKQADAATKPGATDATSAASPGDKQAGGPAKPGGSDATSAASPGDKQADAATKPGGTDATSSASPSDKQAGGPAKPGGTDATSSASAGGSAPKFRARDLGRAVPVPASHKAGWIRFHGSAAPPAWTDAGQRDNACLTCHARSDCISCHATQPPRDHTSSWRLRTHGFEADANKERCETCHRQDACVRCHNQTPPRTHVATWTSQHCTWCHIGPGRSIPSDLGCSVCHKTLRPGHP